MFNLFCNAPNPYLFKGGNSSDYEVFIGKAGTWCTRHIESNQVVQSVQPSANLGGNVLQFANLALGVLNLGVGIYSAFKIHKVHDELTEHRQEIDAGFGNIAKALNAQYRMLELLTSNQNRFFHRLDILRQEMHLGFQKVLEEIQDVEARRQREEFETRTFKVLAVYKRFGDTPPDASEADRLIDRTEELEAWLRTQLNRIEKGQAERLPLLAVLCFSVRAKADAFDAKGGKYSEFSIRELHALKTQISKEAYDFCQGRSLYALGVEMPEIVSQYVLLNRGIQKGINLQQTFADINVLFSQEDLVWDDGLDELRSIFYFDELNNRSLPSAEKTEVVLGKASINLKTLSDYDWYVRFANESRDSFDVHSQPSVALSEILQKIGYPRPKEAKIYKQHIPTLMHFSLPDTLAQSTTRVQAEFQWEKRPQLLNAAT